MFDIGPIRGKVEPKDLFDGRLLEAANRFDLEQVRQQARSWNG